jgi:hypothetical protein
MLREGGGEAFCITSYDGGGGVDGLGAWQRQRLEADRLSNGREIFFCAEL